jgi:hypothetical protein
MSKIFVKHLMLVLTSELWAHLRVRLGGASKPKEGSCNCKTPAQADPSSLVPLLRLQKMGSELPTCNVMLSQCTKKNWVDTSGLDSNHIFRHVVLGTMALPHLVSVTGPLHVSRLVNSFKPTLFCC